MSLVNKKLRNDFLNIFFTAQKMKFSIKDFFSKCAQIRRKFWILVTFTEQILNRKPHFCAALERYKEQLLLKENQTLEVVYKKRVLIDFAGKHLCWSFFLTKLPAFRSATLWKRESSRGVFLAKLEKLLIALILKNIFKLLPLLRYRQKFHKLEINSSRTFFQRFYLQMGGRKVPGGVFA